MRGSNSVAGPATMDQTRQARIRLRLPCYKRFQPGHNRAEADRTRGRPGQPARSHLSCTGYAEHGRRRVDLITPAVLLELLLSCARACVALLLWSVGARFTQSVRPPAVPGSSVPVAGGYTHRVARHSGAAFLVGEGTGSSDQWCTSCGSPCGGGS